MTVVNLGPSRLRQASVPFSDLTMCDLPDLPDLPGGGGVWAHEPAAGKVAGAAPGGRLSRTVLPGPRRVPRSHSVPLRSGRDGKAISCRGSTSTSASDAKRASPT